VVVTWMRHSLHQPTNKSRLASGFKAKAPPALEWRAAASFATSVFLNLSRKVHKLTPEILARPIFLCSSSPQRLCIAFASHCTLQSANMSSFTTQHAFWSCGLDSRVRALTISTPSLHVAFIEADVSRANASIQSQVAMFGICVGNWASTQD
jgi:hypothetical protein